jgi:D-sedoheptulose 7-phosphate isomerase
VKTSTDEYRLKTLFQTSQDATSYVRSAGKRMAELLSQLDHAAIGGVVHAVREAGRSGRSIFTIGNGGSAAVASHFVNDMGVNSWVDGQPGFHVQCLSDNFASVTAVANDVSFEDVFRRQLECNLKRGDVLIAMSVSGNSENIVRAVHHANESGAVTVGMCGFSGGRLAEIAQHLVHVRSTADEYGPVEDAFSVVCHMISSYLTMERGRFLHH